GPVVGPRQRRVASSVGSIFLSPALDMLRLLSAVHRTPASLGLGQIPTHGSRCQYTRVAGKDLSTPSGPCGPPAPNSPNTPPPKEFRGYANRAGGAFPGVGVPPFMSPTVPFRTESGHSFHLQQLPVLGRVKEPQPL